VSGARAGIPWLGWTCGKCEYCVAGRENLCGNAGFTGFTLDGGYAEYAIADERYCFEIPDEYTAEEAAPLLCAGLIGFRAYRFAGDARRIGFYGFGSSAQILAQLASDDGREVFAFTREGDTAAQTLARETGAVWAGAVGQAPQELDAAIIFAPAGALPSFPYELLWGERSVRSVANLTRADGDALFERLKRLKIRTKRTVYPLERANEALNDLRSGALSGTAVVVP
jgi:alcohol dehydrogenase, propanol-preferring